MPNIYLMCVMIILVITCILLLIMYYKHTIKIEYLKKQITKSENEKKNLTRNFEILRWNYQVNKLALEKNSKYKPNKKIRALIADYYETSAVVTNEVLISMGIETEFVTNGEDLLMKINEQNDYDIIFTSNVLSGKLDGVQVLGKLRKIERFNIPVIILTTSKDCEYFLNECGFDDYIEKVLDVYKAKKSLKKVISNLKFIEINNE